MPYDHDGSEEIASDCFDRFVRIYGVTGLGKWQQWVGRSIAGLKKNYLREQWVYRQQKDETEDPMERPIPVRALQDDAFDFKRCLEWIEELDDPERSAFKIIADGGNVKHIMEELRIGPKEALAVIAEGRRKLRLRAQPGIPANDVGQKKAA